MTDWANLIDAVETEEVRVRQEPVDVPDGVVAMLTKLQTGKGPNGGALRASLPVSSLVEFEHIKRVLRKASDSLTPAASVTTKPVYAEGDEYLEEVTSEPDSTGAVTVTKRLRVKDGAAPIKVTFTVGTRRGRKSDAAETADIVSDPATMSAVAEAEAETPKSRHGKK